MQWAALSAPKPHRAHLPPPPAYRFPLKLQTILHSWRRVGIVYHAIGGFRKCREALDPAAREALEAEAAEYDEDQQPLEELNHDPKQEICRHAGYVPTCPKKGEHCSRSGGGKHCAVVRESCVWPAAIGRIARKLGWVKGPEFLRSELLPAEVKEMEWRLKNLRPIHSLMGRITAEDLAEKHLEGHGDWTFRSPPDAVREVGN